MSGSLIVRWLILSTLLLGLILIPFVLFGEDIETWARGFIESSVNRILVAIVLGGLLASDILLPVPSSIVSTACGALLGFGPGVAVSWLGMTISCLAGYAIGRNAGGPVGCALVGQGEVERLELLHRRFGSWMIVITRPVPVLAEAGVLLAGMGRMPFRRFMLMAALSNLGVSLGYAAVGAWSAEFNSFLLAFAGALLLPGLAMLVGKWFFSRAKRS